MSLEDNISIIIPYCPNTEDGKKIFKWSYTRLKIFFPEAEFLVHVCDDIKNFNRSKIINNLVKKSTKDILLIIESNVAFDMHSMIIALDLISKFNAITPYGYVHVLTKEETYKLINHPDTLVLRESEFGNCEVIDYLMGSYVLVNKKIFNDIGGYDEDIVEWAYEKNNFVDRIQEKFGNTVLFHGEPAWNLWDNRNCLMSIKNVINIDLI